MVKAENMKTTAQSNQTIEHRIAAYQQTPYKFMREYPLPLQLDGKVDDFNIAYFDFGAEEKPRRYLVLTKGSVEGSDSLLLRLNSKCPWGTLDSAQCDCHWQFEEAKKRISEEGIGMLIYAWDHVGKGVGLENHHRINLEAHLEHPEIPLFKKDIWYDGFVKLAGKVDYRRFDDFADILAHYDIKGVRLLTNNPEKITELEKYSIKVERVPFEAPANKFNITEYYVKREKGHHMLKIEPAWKRRLRKYTILGSAACLMFGIGMATLAGYYYYRLHRFDEVTAETVVAYKPSKFREYLLEGPEKGPRFPSISSDTKKLKLFQFLNSLDTKEKLSKDDIEKVRLIIENWQSSGGDITFGALTRWLKRTGDRKLLEEIKPAFYEEKPWLYEHIEHLVEEGANYLEKKWEKPVEPEQKK